MSLDSNADVGLERKPCVARGGWLMLSRVDFNEGGAFSGASG